MSIISIEHLTLNKGKAYLEDFTTIVFIVGILIIFVIFFKNLREYSQKNDKNNGKPSK